MSARNLSKPPLLITVPTTFSRTFPVNGGISILVLSASRPSMNGSPCMASRQNVAQLSVGHGNVEADGARQAGFVADDAAAGGEIGHPSVAITRF